MAVGRGSGVRLGAGDSVAAGVLVGVTEGLAVVERAALGLGVWDGVGVAVSPGNVKATIPAPSAGVALPPTPPTVPVKIAVTTAVALGLAADVGVAVGVAVDVGLTVGLAVAACLAGTAAAGALSGNATDWSAAKERSTSARHQRRARGGFTASSVDRGRRAGRRRTD